jgi:hypothetical protein
LILGGSGDAPVSAEMVEEVGYLGCPHLLWVSHAVEVEVALDQWI